MNLPRVLQREVDDAHAIIRYRFPWWLRPFVLRDVAGITLGRRVYLECDDVTRVLRHELVHVRQIARLGVFRFYWSYLREYAAIRGRGRGNPIISAGLR